MKKLLVVGIVSTVFIALLSSVALGEKAGIGVRVILASHQGKALDARLQDIQKNLDTLNYSSYQLLQERSFLLAQGQSGQLSLAGNKELYVKLLQEQGGTAEIAVEILEGGKGIFKTTAKLKKGGTLLIGGPKHEEGVLILAIAAQGP